MNIFYLDKDPKKAAVYHCDTHVVKMIIESAQLLSTAHRVLDGELGTHLSANNRKIKHWILPDSREEILYKATHYNHPCAIWVRQSYHNYEWLYKHFDALCWEYYTRYNRVHLTQTKLLVPLAFSPDNIPTNDFTDPPQAMDLYPQCKVPGNTVQAYRNYYKEIKAEIAEWRYSPKPYWYN